MLMNNLDAEFAVIGLRRIQHGGGFLVIPFHGLFAEVVLPGVQRLHGNRAVKKIRQADVDVFDLIDGQQLFVVGKNFGDPVLLCDFLRLLLIDISDGDDFCLIDLRIGPEVRFPDHAAADDPDFQCLRHGCLLGSVWK